MHIFMHMDLGYVYSGNIYSIIMILNMFPLFKFLMHICVYLGFCKKNK